MIDVQNPNGAYIFGLLQADGSFNEQSRGRGKISIELQLRDGDILKKIKDYLPVYASIRRRTRDTNFKSDYKSIVLSVFNQDFRKRMKELGMEPGKRKSNIGVPKEDFCSTDFFRGVFDGDGSLGVTGNGFPFMSLVTGSINMKEAWEGYIEDITGKVRNTNRNKRDGVFNVMVQKEAAQKLSQQMYYNDSCLCLSRKLDKTKEMMEWERSNDTVKTG